MFIRKIAAAALLGVAAIGLSACATGQTARVTRYSAMPIAQGQSFYVVPGEGTQGGLEFSRYASIVAQQLAAKGYRQAASTAAADMLVKVSYGVDEGEAEYRAEPFMRPRYGGFYDPFYGGYYGRPYWSRYGYYGRYRDPFYWGWGDPYGDPFYGGMGYYGRGYYGGPGSVREYTVYESELDLDIVRRVDNAQLFDGRAVARSGTDELGVLVPNLIEAMFTNFPGTNGETVKITVPARKRG